MPGQREIRYIGVAWQVTSLPDGTKEVTFNDPDEQTLHVLPLPKVMAEAMAAQLRGDEESRLYTPEGPAPRGPDYAGGDTFLPHEPYPPEHQ